jgi:hypothetical protein
VAPRINVASDARQSDVRHVDPVLTTLAGISRKREITPRLTALDPRDLWRIRGQRRRGGCSQRARHSADSAWISSICPIVEYLERNGSENRTARRVRTASRIKSDLVSRLGSPPPTPPPTPQPLNVGIVKRAELARNIVARNRSPSPSSPWGGVFPRAARAERRVNERSKSAGFEGR